MRFEPDQLDVLTFDCYGTLINWEPGILGTLEPILSAHAKALPAAEILELYGEFEAEAEAGPYQNYRDVLATVTRKFGERLSFAPTSKQQRALADGLPNWRPWPDTQDALRTLQSKFRLAVISNIDDDLFDQTREVLDIDFAHVITAQRARCYKPGLEIFERAIEAIGIPAARMLHVGQSLYHDVRPAQTLGIPTVWVNRPSARKNVGAVRPGNAVPDLEVSDLKSLATILLRSQ